MGSGTRWHLMRAGGSSGTDASRIAGACVATATGVGGGPPTWVDTRAVSGRWLDLTSALPCRWLAAHALSDGGGRLSAGSRPARSDREKCPVGTVAGRELDGCGGRPGRVSPSVTSEPARRLDAVQFGKIKRAYLRQLLCGRGLRETGGQVVEPSLVLILEVEQSAHRILPALRSGAAIPRWSVMAPR